MAGVPVEGGALLGRAGEPQLVGLAVHGEQVARPSSASTDTGAGAPPTKARERPAAVTMRRSTSAVVVIELAAGVVRRDCAASDSGSTEQPAVDGGLLGAGAHPGRVGAAAEQQQQAGDHHRLAGAGLAGDHGQAGPERQHGVVDDAEARDPQLLQHDRER